MADHRQIILKIKFRLLTLCFNTVNDRTKFDYWGKIIKKNFFDLFFLWSDNMDIEI